MADPVDSSRRSVIASAADFKARRKTSGFAKGNDLLETFKDQAGFGGAVLIEGLLRKKATGPIPRWQERYFTIQVSLGVWRCARVWMPGSLTARLRLPPLPAWTIQTPFINKQMVRARS